MCIAHRGGGGTGQAAVTHDAIYVCGLSSHSALKVNHSRRRLRLSGHVSNPKHGNFGQTSIDSEAASLHHRERAAGHEGAEEAELPPTRGTDGAAARASELDGLGDGIVRAQTAGGALD